MEELIFPWRLRWCRRWRVRSRCGRRPTSTCDTDIRLLADRHVITSILGIIVGTLARGTAIQLPCSVSLRFAEERFQRGQTRAYNAEVRLDHGPDVDRQDVGEGIFGSGEDVEECQASNRSRYADHAEAKDDEEGELLLPRPVDGCGDLVREDEDPDVEQNLNYGAGFLWLVNL